MNMNEARADWAEKALYAFAGETGQFDQLDDPEGLDEVIRDLITDLGHLARANDLDVDLMFDRAMGMFYEEVPEDDDLPYEG